MKNKIADGLIEGLKNLIEMKFILYSKKYKENFSVFYPNPSNADTNGEK
ncbi:hypothetical protein J8V57_05705 [Xenorhabdus sp. PB61.4]|nr:hypothetical protein [Xenorhabdus sp. PB61.4]MCC8365778.1 hypothetical protein [Xenorhabdus sp. PB61.4]